jgi:hypothetical protein
LPSTGEPCASNTHATRTIPRSAPACDPALTCRSPVLAGRRDFRHFVTAITGGGWVLCEVKALSHGTKGQSNGYHQFGYYRRDRIRRLVGLYGCAVEGWEGGCACGVGPDLTACDYVAVASRRNTGRILTERYRGLIRFRRDYPSRDCAGILSGQEAAAARLNEVHRRAHLMFRPRSPGRRAAAVPCGPEGSPPINLLRK